MRTIFAEYNPQYNSIDVYTSAGYMLRIDCWEAEKNLKTISPFQIFHSGSDLYVVHDKDSGIPLTLLYIFHEIPG